MNCATQLDLFSRPREVAALYVDAAGCYAKQAGVDLWPEARDARRYEGPHPVVAHPPCQRWGKYWHGSPRKPHQYRLGDDGGCFERALAVVRTWGGVLEHPCDSRAWGHFSLARPPRTGGWVLADEYGGWTCCVYQGRYGHFSGKATWLYAVGTARPELAWGVLRQQLPQWMIERYGEKKAKRIGVMAMVGGKNKTHIREATPEPFRDLLLSLARTVPPSFGPRTPATLAP
jgi:hypothetical protein